MGVPHRRIKQVTVSDEVPLGGPATAVCRPASRCYPAPILGHAPAVAAFLSIGTAARSERVMAIVATRSRGLTCTDDHLTANAIARNGNRQWSDHGGPCARCGDATPMGLLLESVESSRRSQTATRPAAASSWRARWFAGASAAGERAATSCRPQLATSR